MVNRCTTLQSLVGLPRPGFSQYAVMDLKRSGFEKKVLGVEREAERGYLMPYPVALASWTPVLNGCEILWKILSTKWLATPDVLTVSEFMNIFTN